MSYRRKRDDWDDFLKRHGEELIDCGLPSYLVRDRKRFLLFLDHGYDEWGWSKDRHGFFTSRALTDAQIQRLARIVGNHIDAVSGQVIASRWKRNYYAK